MRGEATVMHLQQLMEPLWRAETYAPNKMAATWFAVISHFKRRQKVGYGKPYGYIE